MQIFVKTIAGDTIALEVEPESTIEQLKKGIEERAALPPDHQCLVYEKRILDNNQCTLREYNVVQNGSTLQMIVPCVKRVHHLT